MNISIVIPHYNNAKYIPETLKHIINDDRVNEIIICDDVSKDLKELENYLNKINNNKIKLYKNNINLGAYHNKLESLSKCTNDWCILLDSDNCLNENTIDILYSLDKWDNNIIYAPSWAKTFPGITSENLDYRVFKNKFIDKKFVLSNFYTMKLQCLLNTGNYFLHKINYLESTKKYSNMYDRILIGGLDVLLLSCSWILENNKIFVVENFEYNHRLHSDSFYVLSNKSNEAKFKKILLELLSKN